MLSTKATLPNSRRAMQAASSGDAPRSMWSCADICRWLLISCSRFSCLCGSRPKVIVLCCSLIEGTGLKPALQGGQARAYRHEQVRAYKASFVAQRHHGIDTHGAARRDAAGGQRDQRQDKGYADEGERIGGAHAVEHARHELRERERRGEANDDADRRQLRALSQDHA